MAEDPSLVREVEALATALPPADALRTATERHAAALASLDDALLAARAADVRELGRRAVRALSGGGAAEPPGRPSTVVARELGPAELVDLRLEEGLVLGIALAEGSATSHAAIIARSLGVPMVAALGNDVLAVRIGDELIVDGTTGTAMVHPGRPALARIRATAAANAAERLRLAAGRGEPCVTAAGRPIRVLAHASSPAAVHPAPQRRAGGDGVPLGAMIETPTGATRAAELALAADFFSIGTNDLVATTLGLDRDRPVASPLSAADPAVVAHIARTIDAAHAAGITVEICGEAAGEGELTPLPVGPGVRELSVSPARPDAAPPPVRRSGRPGARVRPPD